uniref:Uncharacterized protein n=1 Tax=Vitis vinifera TaxID=29760 RepID=A5B7J0_VITVI|nr:hypothetical protein VITISV_038999 [Vitis vinifera]
MESGLSSLGSSLLVPCVQELVKEPLTAVPHRYLRPHHRPPLFIVCRFHPFRTGEAPPCLPRMGLLPVFMQANWGFPEMKKTKHLQLMGVRDTMMNRLVKKLRMADAIR